MKIDFLIGRMSNGGAERVVSILANYMDEQGHEVRIITFHGKDDYVLNGTIKRIRLHKQPVIRSVVLNGFFSLCWFYRRKENRPDVISSHITTLAFMTIPVALFYRIKIVVSEHINHLVNNTLKKRILRKRIYPLADAVTILTSYDLPYYSKYIKNVHVIANPSSFKIREYRENSTPSKKQIVAIGDLNRYTHKGFDNLMNIAREVVSIHPDWEFTIVGGGNIGLKYLKDLAEELQVADKVVFTGFTTRVRDILWESAIFILPSRYEGLPMSLLEAMSQGVPSIAYDCVSGPSDIIIDGINGLLIENQDKEAMVQGLDRLIRDAGLREEFRKAAPATMQKFDIAQVGQQWTRLLSSVLEKS